MKIQTENKNTFQSDAYCPLVDSIPACTVAGGVYLPGGIPAWAVYLPGVCTCLGSVPACGGVPAWGVPARGGVCTCQGYLPGGTCPGMYLSGGVPEWGGYLPGKCTCQGIPAWGCTCLGGACPGTPPWTDRHLWKHNLRKLRLRAVKIFAWDFWVDKFQRLNTFESLTILIWCCQC